jgi:excinuclease UvrABC nuclease subunit
MKIDEPNAREIDYKSGVEFVYFLIHKEEVVYVGRTLCLRSRIDWHRGHNYSPRRTFDRVFCIETTVKEAPILEKRMIQKYQPSGNIQHIIKQMKKAL